MQAVGQVDEAGPAQAGFGIDPSLSHLALLGVGANLDPQEALVRALAPRLGQDPQGPLDALRAGWAG